METIADRLKWALEQSDSRSMRSLHRELQGRGLFEGTYSAMHRYFTGEVEEPPLSFLKGAAEVLEVPPGWLAMGDQAGKGITRGRSVDVDLRVSRAVGPGRGDTYTRGEILDGLRAGLGGQPGDAWLPTLEAVFWRRWSAQEEYLTEDRRLDVRTLAKSIGRAAVASITALGIDPEQLERHELEYFIPFMYGPLMQLAGVFTDPNEEDVEQ